MKHFRDGTTEDGEGLGVEGLQSAGLVVYGNLGGHVQSLIEDEFYLLVRLAVALDQTGTGVELDPAASPDGHLRVYGAAADGGLADGFQSQRA